MLVYVVQVRHFRIILFLCSTPKLESVFQKKYALLEVDVKAVDVYFTFFAST